MSTVANLIDRIRRDYLSQGRVEPRNRLAIAITTGDVLITFAYPLDNMQPGCIISIDLEDIYVWSTSEPDKNASVDRGTDGTVPAAHSTTDRVRVSPRWTDSQILRAINDELANLYAQGLYKVGTTELDYTSANVGYALPATVGDVRRVQAQDYTGRNWIPVDGWRVAHNQNTTDFASGTAIFLNNGAIEGRKALVTWRGEFDPLTALTDDTVTDAGLSASATDVLAMGAAISLLVGREVGSRLAESQGSTRRAEETPPGAISQSFTPIIRQYQARLRAERTAQARRDGAM